VHPGKKYMLCDVFHKINLEKNKKYRKPVWSLKRRLSLLDPSSKERTAGM
jgi:hypothetical protein